MTFYELKEIFGSHFFKTWLIYIYIYRERERERERESVFLAGETTNDLCKYHSCCFLGKKKKKNEVAVIS